MDYRELFREENEAVRERHELALERIRQIGEEETVREPYRLFFRSAAAFALLAEETY